MSQIFSTRSLKKSRWIQVNVIVQQYQTIRNIEFIWVFHFSYLISNPLMWMILICLVIVVLPDSPVPVNEKIQPSFLYVGPEYNSSTRKGTPEPFSYFFATLQQYCQHKAIYCQTLREFHLKPQWYTCTTWVWKNNVKVTYIRWPSWWLILTTYQAGVSSGAWAPPSGAVSAAYWSVCFSVWPFWPPPRTGNSWISPHTLN